MHFGATNLGCTICFAPLHRFPFNDFDYGHYGHNGHLSPLKMNKKIIQTDSAPKAIGSYSQAVSVSASRLVFISGQIPLDPQTGEMVSEEAHEQIRQAFTNFLAVVKASGGSTENIVKMNIYLIDLHHFAPVNSLMEELIAKPFPARAVVQVAALPRNALIEIDGFLALDE